jgi:hypothetical protein
MKDIPATVRVVTELEEKRCQQAVDAALGCILEVEVVIRDQCRPSFLHVLDVLDNSGTFPKYEFSITEADKKSRTTKCFFPHQLKIEE